MWHVVIWKRRGELTNNKTECKNSKECAPAKHHFDECVERVTAAQDNGGTTEDCVEECESFSLSTRPLLKLFSIVLFDPFELQRSGWSEPYWEMKLLMVDGMANRCF